MNSELTSGAAPLVSVVLPVFNGELYLGEAIQSILNQTFSNFELLILDDGSTDGSLAVAQHYADLDPRVRVYANEQNRGRAATDNWGYTLAQGRYIAKMDADDVALPQRLHRQYNFLEARPAVALTSSFLQTFGATRTVYEYPLSSEEVRAFLLFDTPVGNSSVFFRRDLLTKHPHLRYDEQIPGTYGEDYDWLARVAQVEAIENQPEVLLRYRTYPAGERTELHAQRAAQVRLLCERVLMETGFQASDAELALHHALAHYPYNLGSRTLPEAHAWLLRLAEQNERLRYTDPLAMRRVVAARWFWACYHCPTTGVNAYRTFYAHSLSVGYVLPGWLRLRFWLKNTFRK